jgi:hypothetical protein
MRYQTYIKKFKSILVQFIDQIDIKHTNKGRPRKFKTDFYVKYILQVLTNGISWNKLDLEDIYGNKYCTHSAIYKMYYKWLKMGIFKKVFLEFFNKYSCGRKFNKLFIDSTVIQNANNSKHVGFSYKIPNKKSLKLSVICDNNKIILGSYVSKSNIHDSKLVLNTVNKISVNINNSKLIGDCGYISKQKIIKQLKTKNLTLITPIKKNMKKKVLSTAHKKLLKRRFVIEHLFSHIKRSFKRLSILYDRHEQIFYNWIMMINTIMIIKFLDNG